MPSTPILGLALPVQGTLAGTWGTTVNDAITSLVEQAIAETVTISTDADKLLTTTTEASNEARRAIILWTAGGTTTRNITAPAASKTYIVINATSSTQSIVFKASATTGVTIVAGEKCVVAWNGSDFVKISSTTGNASVTTVGNSFYTLTNPGAITFPRINANNTVSALSAADFRTAIGAGTGGGDVVGPASSTDNAFVRFDTTTGKLIQNSTGATLTDAGAATFTGSVDIAGTSAAGSNIKLYEDTDNGTNYVSFKAADTIAANITWTLPAADGTNGQFLSTNASGTLSWSSTLVSPTVNAGYTEQVVTNTNVGTGGYTINLASGSIFDITLTGSPAPLTFPTATAGRSFMLFIRQGGTGTVTRTVTWPASVEWPGGTNPVLSTIGGRADKFIFTADGTYWYGSVGGLNYIPG